jgi:hypothetical protein
VNVRSQFAATGNLLNSSDPNPRAINDQQPAFAFAVNFGTSQGTASFAIGHVRTPLISYGQSATPLLPLWTRYYSDWQTMTANFLAGAGAARTRSIALDAEIQQQATNAAGSGYAAACALALRQCYGGTELAIGTDGTPWLLGKEISSDGDTNTVDIFDQAFLAWLWLDPDLIPLVMAPILNWCASPAWQSSSAWAGISPAYYCVHDLGAYPNAAGRVPGNGEQMPIEESAGMLIMAAAYARAVGSAVAEPFLNQWRTLFAQWADYLMTQVPTPGYQLTTDDWAPDYSSLSAGVNLGIKAIIGLAAAGQIATIIGDLGERRDRQRRQVGQPLHRQLRHASERPAGCPRHLDLALQRLLRARDRHIAGPCERCRQRGGLLRDAADHLRDAAADRGGRHQQGRVAVLPARLAEELSDRR